MARIKLSAEEKAEKRAEKTAKMRELAKQVEAMTQEQREELAGGVVTIEGHALSVCNACLVVSQNPTASVVGGFQQWIRAGRCVRKGEHGLMIWIPTKRKEDPNRQPGELSSTDDRQSFVIGYVFDVSQTEECQKAA